MTLTLTHFLLLSAILVAAGVMTMALKRTAVGILMGAELIVTAATLNFVAFNAFLPAASPTSPRLDGQLFALFIILLAALQAVMVVAIMVNLRNVGGPTDKPSSREAVKS